MGGQEAHIKYQSADIKVQSAAAGRFRQAPDCKCGLTGGAYGLDFLNCPDGLADGVQVVGYGCAVLSPARAVRSRRNRIWQKEAR